MGGLEAHCLYFRVFKGFFEISIYRFICIYAYIFVCICIYTYIFFQKRQLYKNLLKEPKDKQTVNLSHDLQEEN